jgi:hypothetical protein
MKRYCMALLSSLVLMCGNLCFAYDSAPIVGSGVIITQSRSVPSFRSLQLDGDFNTTIACGKEQRVELSGDDNLVPLIKTEVIGDRLHVFSDRSYSTKNQLRLKIHVHDLVAVSVSGVNTMAVNDLVNSSFAIDANGASTFTIAGKTKRLDASLAGGATVTAGDLQADQVSIAVFGAGDADVFAASKLDVNIMGTGTVTYSGHPREVNRQIVGIGKVIQKQ